MILCAIVRHYNHKPFGFPFLHFPQVFNGAFGVFTLSNGLIKYSVSSKETNVGFDVSLSVLVMLLLQTSKTVGQRSEP